MDVNFNIWWGLLGLLPFVAYIVIMYRGMGMVSGTLLCVILGGIINHHGISGIGNEILNSLKTPLAAVGFIIMLGRGLGMVLLETKVAHTIVYGIIHYIGIKTKKRAMFGIMIATMFITALLGTMAGGVAIISPIVVPIAAAVGLSRATVGVLFQGVGEEALTLGPFSPPVVTLLTITGLTYSSMVLGAAIPVAVVTIIVTWFMALRIQRQTENSLTYSEDMQVEAFHPDKKQKFAAAVFLITFLALIAYGISIKAGTGFVVAVMIGLALLVGQIGRLSLDNTFQLFVKGMAGNLWLFFGILLLSPLINYVEMAGGFKALTILVEPLLNSGGAAVTVIVAGLFGAFGVSGNVEAEMITLHTMFKDVLARQEVSMVAWAITLIVATRVTNFIYPGGNMFAMMGFAKLKEIKWMLKNGYMVALAQTILLIVYAILLVKK
ncbi:hypothetical protein ACI7RC_15350 [Brevibacillus sp. B_LB10_24]|uniref:hypothetical protein n=1 Tax=Brevibacillus sp. B_LB10_24 TaxID=3380645 RepID=UPI0038B992C6